MDSNPIAPSNMTWKRTGDLLVCGKYEITKEGEHPKDTEWSLRISGVWDTTYSRLKDAKAAAWCYERQELRAAENVGLDKN